MFTVYKVTNITNGRYYIGVHKTTNPNDRYLGSGKAIKAAVRKYGRNSFVKQVLHIFDTEQEAYAKEIEIVEAIINDPLSYNMNAGGLGSFSLINQNKHLYPNPMKNPESKQRNLESRRANDTPERIALKKEVCRKNIQKAIESNKGRKRPKQSAFMTRVNKQRWAENKELLRDSLASNFEVVSPDGVVYNTNRLEQFCTENHLTYVSVWNSSITGKPVSKGRSKGWICRKI